MGYRTEHTQTDKDTQLKVANEPEEIDKNESQVFSEIFNDCLSRNKQN